MHGDAAAVAEDDGVFLVGILEVAIVAHVADRDVLLLLALLLQPVLFAGHRRGLRPFFLHLGFDLLNGGGEGRVPKGKGRRQNASCAA